MQKTMKNLICTTLVWAVAFVAQSAEPLFGWELEFTNSKLQSSNFGENGAQGNKDNDAAREKWIEVIRKLCHPDRCRIEDIEGWVWWRKGSGEIVESWEETASFRVIYPDGFWYQLSYDSHVVEVQVKPSTFETLKQNEERLQSDLFDTAKKVGLKPTRGEETHVHVGAEAAFDMNLLQIRNYLVDGVNHPEFSYLFSTSIHNAPPLAALTPEQYRAFEVIVADVDSRKMKSVEDFIKAIRKKVYHQTLDPDMANNEYDQPQKYQQHNLERMKKSVKDSEKTLEDRAQPQPLSARELILLTQLKDARIAFVKSQKKPITLNPRPAKLDKKTQVEMFRDYVQEAGLKPADYRVFMSTSCQKILGR